MSENKLRLRQTLDSKKICASEEFHLTFAVTKVGFFSAGYSAGWNARSEEWPNRFNPVKLSGVNISPGTQGGVQ
jgi:hypothetical protein